jgi:hypothetical protein
MPHDKYRNWPLPRKEGNIFPVRQGTDIEKIVLKDLAEATDETDKLEILDSFATYYQRVYQQEVAEAISFWAARIIRGLLEPNMLSYLPAVECRHRARVAKEQ